jgi:hypothetical protein
MSEQIAESQQVKEKDKDVRYFVNGEKQESDEKKLTANAILAAAGFEPVGDWILSRDKDGHAFAGGDVVEIHKDERFTAKHKAPTPTS